jgi:hypothetical protein
MVTSVTVCTKSFEILRFVIATILIAMVNDEMAYILIAALFATNFSFPSDRLQKTINLISVCSSRCLTWPSSRFPQALNAAKVLFSGSCVSLDEHDAAEPALVFPCDGTFAPRPFTATFHGTECRLVAVLLRERASALLAFKVLMFSRCLSLARFAAKYRRFSTTTILPIELLLTPTTLALWFFALEPCPLARTRTEFSLPSSCAFKGGEFLLTPRAYIAGIHGNEVILCR